MVVRRHLEVKQVRSNLPGPLGPEPMLPFHPPHSGFVGANWLLGLNVRTQSDYRFADTYFSANNFSRLRDRTQPRGTYGPHR